MSSTEVLPTVLLATEHLLAVNKPAGMPAQPDPTGDPSLLDWATTSTKAGATTLSLGMPHRIDRPVSGVVMLTRSTDALRVLSELFRSGLVKKTYLAVVEGSVEKDGVREDRLIHDGRSHKARVREEDQDGAISRLRYRPLVRGERYTLLEVKPEGGAFHQIRAQLAAMGHSIKGDVKYGARRGEPDRSIALHARSIGFNDPLFGGPVLVSALVPNKGIWTKLCPAEFMEGPAT